MSDRESSLRRAATALRHDPLAVAGSIVLALLVFVGIFGPWLAPYGTNEIDIGNMLQHPTATHLFGTDELGRDVFSRVIVAARVSLEVAVVSVGLALVVGVGIGLVAGY